MQRRRFVSLLMLWALAFLPAALASPPLDTLPLDILLEQLRAGGYVLYIRHGATNHNQLDAPRLDLDDCATQRNLSADGRHYARRLGEFLRHHAIPIGEVISSPFCRARDTARLAFSEYRREDFLYFSIGMSRDQRLRTGAQLADYLNRAPAAGRNNAVIAHTSNLKEAVGIWPKQEGEIHVFAPRPDGAPEHIGVIGPAVIRNWRMPP